MLTIAERHKYILEALNKNGFIKVSDIAKELDVTLVTIRKDLKRLESQKLLYRTHGSASPINPHTTDRKLQEKEKINNPEKKQIALSACKLIEENDTIIIASGSTTHAFAQELKPESRLTVVCSSLKTSLLLNEVDNIEVIQLGGAVRKNSYSVIGDYAAELFNQITCSKLFLGVDGVDLETGAVSNSNIEEAALNKIMLDASLRVIILADSSKFGRRGFGKICSLDKIDTIITDSRISQATATAIEEFGVELIIS